MLTSGAQGQIDIDFNSMSVMIQVDPLERDTWNDVDWISIQTNVRKIQYRIYEASRSGNTGRLHWLQNMLINRMDSKLLAVRIVTTLNKGRRTADVDKKVVTDSKLKFQLANSLSLDGKSSPIRRVWIDKPGKVEKRPLGIPTIDDRAKQALAKLALEPEWEAKFEPSSYGFRPGRSPQDAIERIFTALHHGVSKMVFDADIKKCFDQINQDALLIKLDTFPLMKRQVRAWLKSGVMEGYANSVKPSEILETDEGTPQGGIISPLLANLALHGLEFHLKNFVSEIPGLPYPGANRSSACKRKALTFVRYADDFVVIHRNKQILESCIEEVKIWLTNVGLEISEEKSALRDCREGFDFLGFRVIQFMRKKTQKYKVKIYPSRKNQAKLLSRIRKIIQEHKAVSSYELILMLRPVIIGWGNYFKFSECSNVFSLTRIFQKVRAWVFRRDTRSGRLVVKQKYFPSGNIYNFAGRPHFDNWVLVGKSTNKKGDVVENHLPHLIWVKSAKHIMVKGDSSPYDRSLAVYWSGRSTSYSPYSTRVAILLKRQKQFCPLCRRKFEIFDSLHWEVDHSIPRFQGGKDEYKNLQLVHKSCHNSKTAKEKSS